MNGNPTLESNHVLNTHRVQIAHSILECYTAATTCLPTTAATLLHEVDEVVAYLVQAVSLHQPAIFHDYVAWLKVLFLGRAQSTAQLATLLNCTQQTLEQHLSGAFQATTSTYMAQAIAQLPKMPTQLPTLLDDSNPYDDLAKQYLSALIQYDRHRASTLIFTALDAGVSIKDIYLHVFQRSQHEIGRLWQINRLSVGQEHFCTAATQLIMAQLYPRIFATPKHGLRMVAASVSNDLHEMGIRMIADFFEMEGWDTLYLGAHTPSQSIAQIVVERRAAVLALSATIALHVPAVSETIQVVRASAVGHQIKIVVGGYPFNTVPDLWRQVGADGSATNAVDTVLLAKQLVNHAGT